MSEHHETRTEAALREWAGDAAAFAQWATPERKERFFGPDGPGELRVVEVADDGCDTCGQLPGVEGECPKSNRLCGHHCNCSWVQDQCCWCGVEFGEGGELTAPPTTEGGDDGD